MIILIAQVNNLVGVLLMMYIASTSSSVVVGRRRSSLVVVVVMLLPSPALALALALALRPSPSFSPFAHCLGGCSYLVYCPSDATLELPGVALLLLDPSKPSRLIVHCLARQSKPSSSFSILHSSFFILHSSSHQLRSIPVISTQHSIPPYPNQLTH